MKFDKFVQASMIALVVGIVSPVVVAFLPFEFVTKWSLLEFAALAVVVSTVVLILLISFCKSFLASVVGNTDDSLEDYARYRGDVR